MRLDYAEKQIHQLEEDKRELVEALTEARSLTKELCQTFGIPEPVASFERFDSLIKANGGNQ